MSELLWVLVALHAVWLVGLLLAAVLVARLARHDRPPGTTLGWLAGIALVPWAAIPLFLLRVRRRLHRLRSATPARGDGSGDGAVEESRAGGAIERALCELGVPRACEGNAIELSGSGEETFARLAALFRSAAETIEVETFTFGADPTGEALARLLAERAREGVAVRVLVDGVGTIRARGGCLAELARAGAGVAVYRPVFSARRRLAAHLRNHRKLVIVDGRTALVGGPNLAAPYMGPEPSEERWTDLAVAIEGPAVRELREVWARDWHAARGEEPAAPASCRDEAPRVPRPGGARVQVLPSGPDGPTEALRDGLLTAILLAARRVWIVTPYFLPDNTTASLLALAARRGRDVRLFVPARSDSRLADAARPSYLWPLRAEGVRVHPFETGMLHAKLVLIDDELAVVGSANFDLRSFYLNHELMLFVHSPERVAACERWVRDTLLPHARELPIGTSVEEESTRLQRIRADMARILAPLL